MGSNILGINGAIIGFMLGFANRIFTELVLKKKRRVFERKTIGGCFDYRV
jgi:hypothetical protein